MDETPVVCGCDEGSEEPGRAWFGHDGEGEVSAGSGLAAAPLQPWPGSGAGGARAQSRPGPRLRCILTGLLSGAS